MTSLDDPSEESKDPVLPAVIKFNVGGKAFAVGRESLSTAKSSFLYKLVTTKVGVDTVDGAYFIDRDPTQFGVVLNWLRIKNATVLPETERQLLTVLDDAKYYMLPELEKVVCFTIANARAGKGREDRDRSFLRRGLIGILKEVVTARVERYAEKTKGQYYVDTNREVQDGLLDVLKDPGYACVVCYEETYQAKCPTCSHVVCDRYCHLAISPACVTSVQQPKRSTCPKPKKSSTTEVKKTDKT